MLITDLSKIKSFKVIERLRMQALLEEMKLGQTGIVDERTAPKVGRLLGTENLTVGNLSLGIQAATAVTSTSRNDVRGTAVCAKEKEKFFELPYCIIQNITKILGIEPTPEEMEAAGIPHTESYDAFIYYGEGLDALDAGEWQKAKDLFEEALKIDPKFDLAREGADSCPGSSSPDISNLGTMTGPQMSEQAEGAVIVAEEAQGAADEAAAEASGGGDGG
jgi:tetratricopeptide (TPR) repeat protein